MSSIESTSTLEPRATLRFPSDAMVGSLGEFARAMATGTEVPEEFYFAAALALTGATCVGSLKLNVNVECEPRFYIVLLGESAGVKKSTALRRVSKFFERIWAGAQMTHPVVMWGAGSAEGLARKLNEAPGGVVLMYDEMHAFVQKSKVQASVLLPMVASLFEQTNWDNATKARNSICLRNAHLSLVGCCTTETYAEMWTSEAIAIGLPNRLFVVAADRKRKVAWPNPRDESVITALEARIIKQLERLPLALDIEPDAKAAWEEWYEGLPSSEHARRLDAIGFRLLAVIALTTDKDCIDLETVETVTKILDYELRVRALTDPVDADDSIARLEEKIRRQLTERGPLSERDLRRYTNARREGLWVFRKAMENLRAAGEINYEPHTRRYSMRLDEDQSVVKNVVTTGNEVNQCGT